MNDFSAKALLLLAALRQYKETPKDWKQGLLQGMSWLCDQLLAATDGHAEHIYEQQRVKLIQSYIATAFKHPEHEVSDQAEEQCCRILPGVPDDSEHA